jgi:hypothetical protein
MTDNYYYLCELARDKRDRDDNELAALRAELARVTQERDAARADLAAACEEADVDVAKREPTIAAVVAYYRDKASAAQAEVAHLRKVLSAIADDQECGVSIAAYVRTAQRRPG